jgi:hypothetical protein
MKISDITNESELIEGPVLNKIGSAIGKGVGTAAKAAGAVAGGVAGLGSALKKGYQAGKSTVAGAGDDEQGNVQLPPAAQKALDVLKSLSPQDQKSVVTALQTPASAPATAAKPASAPATAAKPASAPATAAAPAKPAANTAAPAKATAPAGGRVEPTLNNPANKAGSDSFEKAKSNIRTVQSGTKPVPDKVAQGIQTDLAKLAKGDKESGVFAAQKIMNFAKAGYDVSKLQPLWTANAKQGERFLTQSVYYAITKMLREHNLGWADLGLRIRLVENTNKVVGVNYI